MSDYDSILKEEKKYEEQPPKTKKPKRFPWFKIDLICIILLIAVEYLFYFIKVLNPYQIFLEDSEKLITDYKRLFTPLLLDVINDNDNLEGAIKVNDNNYNYNLNRSDDSFNVMLSKDTDYLIFSRLQVISYLKLSTFKDKYLKFESVDNYPKIINNVKNNLKTSVLKDKFIKRYYLDNNTPIVVSELKLNTEDLKQLTGLNSIEDSYEILLTLKNHAITNNIVNSKVAINNKTTNKRVVLTYDGNAMNYKCNNNNLKFKLEKRNDKDFELKIYKDDVIYSVLTGTSKEKNYSYSYKVIDKIYSIDLDVKREKEIISYTLNSIIEKNGEKKTNQIFLNINTSPSVIGETFDIDESFNYNELSKQDKEQYKESLDNFLIDFNNLFSDY